MIVSSSSPGLVPLVIAGGALLIGCLIVGWLRSRKRVALFFRVSEKKSITAKVSVKNGLLGFFLLLGTSALILALFEPSWGEEKTELPYTGRDIMFCLDISNSMMAGDVVSGRLEVAKVFMHSVISSRTDSSFGITVYKGKGTLLVPLTRDRTFLEDIIADIHPGYSTVPGTNIEEGLLTAARGFSDKRPGKGFIFLLSDGESFDGNPLSGEVREECKGLAVWTFLIGTEEGGEIQGINNSSILTQARPELLRKIAGELNGSYLNVTEEGLWDRFTSSFKDEEQNTRGVAYTYSPAERQHIFVLIGCVFFIFYALGRVIIWKKFI